jgi:predicted TIM-barrel fold metal-dependent hydrolase
MQSHLLSLLTEGVFERFPELKITFVEAGFIWLSALMWRLDQEYKGLRSEVPWVKKKPSDYLRSHVRFTSSPLELTAPNIVEMLEMAQYEQLLMYSSNFPDPGCQCPIELRKVLPEPYQQAIFRENALKWYRLGDLSIE